MLGMRQMCGTLLAAGQECLSSEDDRPEGGGAFFYIFRQQGRLCLGALPSAAPLIL